MIIFGVTNQATYDKVYTRLCEVFTEVRRQGGKTPQIAFLCPFGDPSKSCSDCTTIYTARGDMPTCGFRGRASRDPRRPGASAARTARLLHVPQTAAGLIPGADRPNQWGWLEIYPQHAFYDADGKPEQMTVGVGQNSTGPHLSAFS